MGSGDADLLLGPRLEEGVGRGRVHRGLGPPVGLLGEELEDHGLDLAGPGRGVLDAAGGGDVGAELVGGNGSGHGVREGKDFLIRHFVQGRTGVLEASPGRAKGVRRRQ